MTSINKENIANAANYILKTLRHFKNDGPIVLDHLADDGFEWPNGLSQLSNTLGLSKDLDVLRVLVCAIDQLVKLHIVETESRAFSIRETVTNGVRNFWQIDHPGDICKYDYHEIKLTSFGEEQLAAGVKLEFVGVDY